MQPVSRFEFKPIALSKVSDCKPSADVTISGISDDSRQIQPGDAFLCMPRTSAHAEAFARTARENGAVAIITVNKSLPVDLPSLRLPDIEAVGMLLRKLLATKTFKIDCVGITGTDGKTSIAWMLREALSRRLQKVWSSGTLGLVRSASDIVDIGNTTPSLMTSHWLIRQARKEKVGALVMEVSSHGIEQERIAALPINTAVWTNLGHDHLQDHGGFESYAGLKQKFIAETVKQGGIAICNADDPVIRRLVRESGVSVHWYAHGLYAHECEGNGIDLTWEQELPGMVRFAWQGEEVRIEDIPAGDFHAENLAAVALVLLTRFGFALNELPELLDGISAPPGRMQALDIGRWQVFIDYAHTPEALARCLETARKLARNRLMVVFGCGGNRDREKRPEMGHVAVTLADAVWITSDNPRGELPEVIASEIENGMPKPYPAEVFLELDRKQAITDAIDAMQPGDLLVIAGKGHGLPLCLERLRYRRRGPASQRGQENAAMRLNGTELMQATGGDWRNDMPDSITGISTDTRRFIDGHAFLALRGPNFDGHRFAESVASRAGALIGDREGVKLWDNLGTPQLEVEDTLAALGDIANAWRHRLPRTTVIAVTGSYGKTTVRDMLAHLFKSLGVRTVATHANLNNLIGVPTTLLGIDEATEVAVIECGISEKGEMERLSRIVQPDIAIITGISAAHSAGLGGVEGVAREKSELAAHLLPHGWCLFGPGVASQLQEPAIAHTCIDMDGPDEDIVHWQMHGRKLQLFAAGEAAELELPLPARHWAANMALAATTALKYFNRQDSDAAGRKSPTLQEIADLFAGWQAVSGRMEELRGITGATIIDDSYNANPVSMQAALDTLAQMPGRRIAIIGDMAELEKPAEAHTGLNVSDIDMLILVGPEMKALKDLHPEALWFASTDEALAWIHANMERFDDNDCVLIKASRSMQLDRIARAMAGEETTHAL